MSKKTVCTKLQFHDKICHFRSLIKKACKTSNICTELTVDEKSSDKTANMAPLTATSNKKALREGPDPIRATTTTG